MMRSRMASAKVGSPIRSCQRAGQRHFVLIENGFGEAHEQPAVRHASIPCGRTGHSAQIIVSILGQAARTEQQSVTGGSIETLVCTRDAPWRFARIAALSDAPIDPPSQPSFGPQSARAKKASARIQ